MLCVQGFHHISGAHLNPVISLVQAVTCKVTPLRAALYVIAQSGGAIAGAAILHGYVTNSYVLGLLRSFKILSTKCKKKIYIGNETLKTTRSTEDNEKTDKIP
jgi:glycerol uptake facilitator-like aquaporin